LPVNGQVEADTSDMRNTIQTIAVWRRFAFVLALFWIGSCAFHDETLTTVEIKAPTAAECGQCHVDIYEEWHSSKHAAAFANRSFRELTLDYQVETCLPCHIPETVATEGKGIRARHYYRDEGVTCIACHLIDGEHHGPFFSSGMTTPHATQADPDFYFEADLCGTCHQGTFESWSAVRGRDPAVRTCQQCHMAPVRRKLTQATDLVSGVFVALHDEFDLRRHTFDARIVPEVDAVGFAIESSSGSGDRGSVRVTNLLPHPIPTGDYGFRKAILTVTFTGQDGPQFEILKKELVKDLGSQLDPGESVSVALPDLGSGRSVASGLFHLRLIRVDRQGREVACVADMKAAQFIIRSGEER